MTEQEIQVLRECKILLEAKPPIPLDLKLSDEFMSGLAELRINAGQVERLFMPVPETGATILYEVKCPQCNSMRWVEGSKTKAVGYVKFRSSTSTRDSSNWRPYICENCRLEVEKKYREEIDAIEIKITQNIEQVKERFRTTFLSPNHSWKNYSSKNFYLVCDEVNRIGSGEVCKMIRALPYSDFLKTPYWKAVAMKVKMRAGFKCQMCSSKENLAAHHRSYDLHGYEHTSEGLKEMICICNDCHQIHHEENP